MTVAAAGRVPLPLPWHEWLARYPWLASPVVWALAAVALVFLAAMAARLARPDLPYVAAHSLLTPAERAFFGALRQALGEDYHLFAKVRLGDILEVERGVSGKRRFAAFGRISSKHADFVACDPRTFAVAGVIELDDSSHRQRHRQERDAFFNAAMARAGVPRAAGAGAAHVFRGRPARTGGTGLRSGGPPWTKPLTRLHWRAAMPASTAHFPPAAKPSPALLDPWVWRMAWRDSRRSRGRLLVFSTALTLGVAALVAIGSLGWNLQRAIHEQARTLVGADVVLEGTEPPDATSEALARSFGGVARADETRLASMSTFPKSGHSRLTQVRAISGAYPFYGHIETDPPQATVDFAAGKGALVEESLLLQYGGKLGDPIQIGGVTLPILGSIRKMPGEASAFASIAPRVLIPRDKLSTSLLSRGSLVRYLTYLKLPASADASKLAASHKKEIDARHLEVDTVAHREAQLGRVFTDVNHFLNLVSFVALLLGGIGVASAIHAHLKTKLRTVAVLRCLGASSRQTLTIYLLQALALGLVGALSGAAVGILLQGLAPIFLQGVVPVEVRFGISWLAVGEGVGVGFLTCALFVLLPLLPVRRTPPLLALRAAFEPSTGADRAPDPLRWLAWALLAAALLTFPWLQSRDPRLGFGFSGGLFIAFGLLALTARGLMSAARRYFPQRWPFEWRQGAGESLPPEQPDFGAGVHAGPEHVPAAGHVFDEGHSAAPVRHEGERRHPAEPRVLRHPDRPEGRRGRRRPRGGITRHGNGADDHHAAVVRAGPPD